MVIARNLLRGLTVPLLVLGMGSAQAAMLEGETVIFEWDGSLNALFGTASVSGDTLRFDPTDFVANAAGPGVVIVRATTPPITITAKDLFVLEEVSLFERGNYFRMESGGGTTVVAATGEFTVNDSLNAVSAGGLTTFLTVADVTNNGLPTTGWTASASVAVSGEAATVTLQNVLMAGLTGGLETAFIEKRLVQIGVDTAVIPVPPAVWMLGSALFGLAAIGRRRLAS